VAEDRGPVPGQQFFDAAEHLAQPVFGIPPADYRDWVFLSFGSGHELQRTPRHGRRPHVRQPIRTARRLRRVQAYGRLSQQDRPDAWEPRAKSKGSINQLGLFQTGEIVSAASRASRQAQQAVSESSQWWLRLAGTRGKHLAMMTPFCLMTN